MQPRKTLALVALNVTLLMFGGVGVVQASEREDCCITVDHPNGAIPGKYFFDLGESEYQRAHYASAFARFRLSAHWGYKVAQYNIGMMYFRGIGVARDPSTGMAWLALAAERGEEPYVEAREWAYAQLTPAEFERANETWRMLKVEYADSRALKRATHRFRQAAIATTGSHLGGAAGSHLVINTSSGEIDRAREVERNRQRGNPYEESVYPHVEVGDLVPLKADAADVPDIGSEFEEH